MMKQAMILAGVLALAACSSDGGAEVATTVPATEAPTTTTTEAAATTAPSTTVAVRCSDGSTRPLASQCPTTTLPPATTTTIDPAAEADLTVALWGASVNSDAEMRNAFVTVIEGRASLVESVDKVRFESHDQMGTWLDIAVTTGFNGVEYRDETAWAIARGLGDLWRTASDDGESIALGNPHGTIRTGLRLVVDSTTYLAANELMVQVSELQVTSVDWLNASRQP